MGNFGEDLRMERISRGVALEEITAVTKISQHHLVALEQERFRLLPGGILCKGIVRDTREPSASTSTTGPSASSELIAPQAWSSTTTAAGPPLLPT